MIPELKFYTFLPELVEQMPIKRAEINNFEWYKKMVEDYLSKDYSPATHTSKCPGIISICNEGWIQYAHQDFKITTNGDGKSFKWWTEFNRRMYHPKMYYTLGPDADNYISYHTPSQLFDFNVFKKDTLKSIVKIQSPWCITIPTGFKLLVIPVPYNDCNHFTAVHGILTGTNFLNIQLMWHTLNDEVLIKKGTPLCQYVLLKDENVDYSLNVMNNDTVDIILKNLEERFFKH